MSAGIIVAGGTRAQMLMVLRVLAVKLEKPRERERAAGLVQALSDHSNGFVLYYYPGHQPYGNCLEFDRGTVPVHKRGRPVVGPLEFLSDMGFLESYNDN